MQRFHFSVNDDIAMCRFLYDELEKGNEDAQSPCGLRIWKSAHRKKILLRHSVDSLATRIRRHVLPNLNEMPLPKEIRKCLRKEYGRYVKKSSEKKSNQNLGAASSAQEEVDLSQQSKIEPSNEGSRATKISLRRDVSVEKDQQEPLRVAETPEIKKPDIEKRDLDARRKDRLLGRFIITGKKPEGMVGELKRKAAESLNIADHSNPKNRKKALWDDAKKPKFLALQEVDESRLMRLKPKKLTNIKNSVPNELNENTEQESLALLNETSRNATIGIDLKSCQNRIVSLLQKLTPGFNETRKDSEDSSDQEEASIENQEKSLDLDLVDEKQFEPQACSTQAADLLNFDIQKFPSTQEFNVNLPPNEVEGEKLSEKNEQMKKTEAEKGRNDDEQKESADFNEKILGLTMYQIKDVISALSVKDAHEIKAALQKMYVIDQLCQKYKIDSLENVLKLMNDCSNLASLEKALALQRRDVLKSLQ